LRWSDSLDGSIVEPWKRGEGAMLFGQEHVRRYVETDGAEGHDWNDEYQRNTNREIQVVVLERV
jgi:hypothetical protein